MTLNEYQQHALRTAGTTDTSTNFGLAVLALGVTGEAGEVADYIKKVVGHHHPLDTNKLAKELGDVLWYVAVMANHVGWTLADLAQMNVDKLRARYPDGFSAAASINRTAADQ